MNALLVRQLLTAAALFAATFATNTFAQSTGYPENWTSCTGSLCIDTAPQGKAGLDGSGGWGWDTKAKAPVNTLKVGVPATFTVTMLQSGTTLPFCGLDPATITLTYSSEDFSLNNTDATGTVGTNPFDRGGVAVFTYTGSFLCHGDQSTAFTFTPLHTTQDDAPALVTATITVGGQQAVGTFPIAISKAQSHGNNW